MKQKKWTYQQGGGIFVNPSPTTLGPFNPPGPVRPVPVSVPGPLDVTNFFRSAETLQRQRSLDQGDRALDLREDANELAQQRLLFDQSSAILNQYNSLVDSFLGSAAGGSGGQAQGGLLSYLNPERPQHARIQNRIAEQLDGAMTAADEIMSEALQSGNLTSGQSIEAVRQIRNIRQKTLNGLLQDPEIAKYINAERRYQAWLNDVADRRAKGEDIDMEEFARIQNQYDLFTSEASLISRPPEFGSANVTFNREQGFNKVRESATSAFSPVETVENVFLPDGSSVPQTTSRTRTLEEASALIAEQLKNDPDVRGLYRNTAQKAGIPFEQWIAAQIAPQAREAGMEDVITKQGAPTSKLQSPRNAVGGFGTVPRTDYPSYFDPESVEERKYQYREQRVAELGYDPTSGERGSEAFMDMQQVLNTRPGSGLGYCPPDCDFIVDETVEIPTAINTFLERTLGWDPGWTREEKIDAIKKFGEEGKLIVYEKPTGDDEAIDYILEEPRIIDVFSKAVKLDEETDAHGSLMLEESSGGENLVNANDVGQASVGPHQFRGDLGNQFLQSMGVVGFDLTKPLSAGEALALQRRLEQIPDLQSKSIEFFNQNILPVGNNTLKQYAPSIRRTPATDIMLISAMNNHSPQGFQQIVMNAERTLAEIPNPTERDMIEAVRDARIEYVNGLDNLTDTQRQQLVNRYTREGTRGLNMIGRPLNEGQQGAPNEEVGATIDEEFEQGTTGLAVELPEDADSAINRSDFEQQFIEGYVDMNEPGNFNDYMEYVTSTPLRLPGDDKFPIQTYTVTGSPLSGNERGLVEKQLTLPQISERLDKVNDNIRDTEERMSELIQTINRENMSRESAGEPLLSLDEDYDAPLGNAIRLTAGQKAVNNLRDMHEKRTLLDAERAQYQEIMMSDDVVSAVTEAMVPEEAQEAFDQTGQFIADNVPPPGVEVSIYDIIGLGPEQLNERQQQNQITFQQAMSGPDNVLIIKNGKRQVIPKALLPDWVADNARPEAFMLFNPLEAYRQKQAELARDAAETNPESKPQPSGYVPDYLK